MGTAQLIRHLVSLLLVLAASVMGCTGAFAHTPYMTRSESVALSDGQQGEIRLLHGDGILFADPMRLIALDPKLRLLARSEKFSLITLLCGGEPRSCRGYVHDHARVLTIDPSSLSSTAIETSDPSVEGDDLMWSLESGDQSWGFATRLASPAEILAVEAQFIVRHPVIHGVAVGLGIVAACLALMTTRRPKSSRIWQQAIWILSLLLRIIFIIMIIYSLSLLIVLIPASPIALCSAFSLGILTAMSVRYGVRRFTRVTAGPRASISA